MEAIKDSTLRGWHFVGKNLRNNLPLPADGQVLRYQGELILGEQGLHASVETLRRPPCTMRRGIPCAWWSWAGKLSRREIRW